MLKGSCFLLARVAQMIRGTIVVSSEVVHNKKGLEFMVSLPSIASNGTYEQKPSMSLSCTFGKV